MNPKHPVWTLLAYVLPAVGAAVTALCWLVYCVLAPNRQVDSIVMGGELPEGVICGPWEPGPSGSTKRRCDLDRPFHHYLILERRDGKSWKVARSDAKWARIASATIAGLLVYFIGWNLWTRALRLATRNPKQQVGVTGRPPATF